MHKFSFWDYDMAGRSRSRLAFFLSFLFLLNSCRNAVSDDQVPVTIPFRAFYYWQTEFNLDSLERRRLDQLTVDRLYVKFFDLDWEPLTEEVVPLASVSLDTNGLRARQIIPTIFITNRSLLQISADAVPLLAERIVEKINRQFAVLDQPLRELQLDCDWSAGSRDNYFNLLREIKNLYRGRNVETSVTIRLHQLRYPDQTGVPPVAKGVLMFYNMGNLQDWGETNSILNLEKAEAYLPDGLDYPLHLDLALPLFQWAVLFREGKMIKLINEPNDSLLTDQQKFRPTAPNRYLVQKNTYLDGYYLYRGDQLRVEMVSAEALRSAYQLVKRQYPEATRNLIFYHLDRKVLDRYVLDQLLRLD